MAPPPALKPWFKSAYPTLVFDDEWLNACVDYLEEHFPEKKGQQFIKLVESQLLLSDLATSTCPNPGKLFPEGDASFPPAVNNGHDSEDHKRFDSIYFSPRDASDRKSNQAVLCQIERIDDIADSALSQLEILKEKREYARLKLKREEGTGNKGEHAQEIVIGDGAPTKPPQYSRGVSRMVLSDGWNKLQAFEYSKIPGLGLDEVQLGCKLLIHSIRIINGVAFLTPESVVIKGHMVEEIEEQAEKILEETLRQRLSTISKTGTETKRKRVSEGGEGQNPSELWNEYARNGSGGNMIPKRGGRGSTSSSRGGGQVSSRGKRGGRGTVTAKRGYSGGQGERETVAIGSGNHRADVIILD